MTEQLSQQMSDQQQVDENPQRQAEDQPGSDLRVEQTVDPLFETQQQEDLQRQWREVQSLFVDDPRGAVQKADALVADAVRALVDGFATTRSGLEQEWARDEQPNTEQLRVVFQRYRSFFTRLLEA